MKPQSRAEDSQKSTETFSDHLCDFLCEKTGAWNDYKIIQDFVSLI